MEEEHIIDHPVENQEVLEVVQHGLHGVEQQVVLEHQVKVLQVVITQILVVVHYKEVLEVVVQEH